MFFVLFWVPVYPGHRLLALRRSPSAAFALGGWTRSQFLQRVNTLCGRARPERSPPVLCSLGGLLAFDSWLLAHVFFALSFQAVRVTKPNIPETIRRNYELM